MEKSGAAPMPSVFVSHGTPMLALAPGDEDSFVGALSQFAGALGQPKAIIVVSAHGISQDETIGVSVAEQNTILHDFSGFPKELYQLDYHSQGSPELAVRIAGLLGQSGLQTVLEADRLQDHGVWIPVRIFYPEGQVPVVQLTMPQNQDPKALLKMGRALAPLRNEGILLLGSGGAVHNLEKLVWHGKQSEGEKWALDFESWLIQKLLEKDVESLLQFEDLAPDARLAHPSIEHLLPLFFTIGGSLESDLAFPIYRGIEYGSLSMLSFALAPAPGR